MVRVWCSPGVSAGGSGGGAGLAGILSEFLVTGCVEEMFPHALVTFKRSVCQAD